jgi:hypothetical protein
MMHVPRRRRVASPGGLIVKQPPKKPGPKPVEGAEKKTFFLSLEAMADLEAIRSHYGLTSEAAAVRYAIATVRRQIQVADR